MPEFPSLVCLVSVSLSIWWWWWFSHQAVSNSCNPMDCGLPGFSVHGMSQARILEWVAIPPPGDFPFSLYESESVSCSVMSNSS